jgi:hypothetical protein
VDTSTIISIVSLVIALLALPTSYFVAIRQVKVSLSEAERRSRQAARFRVADALDEFFKVFKAAVKEFTGIETGQLQSGREEIDPQMHEIDALVGRSGVLEQVALAIDNLAATGWAELAQSSDIVDRLQSIRRQIALGSDEKRYATLGVIAAFGGVDLQTGLRTGFRNAPGTIIPPPTVIW